MSLVIDQKRKFLLAMPRPDLRQAWSATIQKHISNSVIFEATNGIDVVQKLNNDMPHILIVVRDLPKKTGEEIVENFLNSRKRENFAAILVGEIPEQEQFVEGIVTGQLQLVPDKVSDAQMVRVINKALNFCSHGDSTEFYLRFLAKGDYLMRQGEKGDYVYIVRRGTLEAVTSADGSPRVLGEITVGEFVGEMAYINGEPRVADVIATGDCELIEIPIDHLDHLLFQKPAWSRALLKTLSKRVKVANERIART